ncbi:hypothetical protein ACOME3_010483 [Neoechinorhynchus agilis]
MTIGKDVSALFTDVVNCMQTDNIELKKLVYLYLMNYAKSQPDLAILAVNTFVKDCEDHNPMIRALAVRTMGCIRVDKITEYLCEPLRKSLRDEDPYVRKTAAVCVAKLHDINAQLVEEQGFLDILKELLTDSNPMVISNAVAALSEIAQTSTKPHLFDLNSNLTNKLLTALNECNEWGQVFILDAIATYSPKDEKEAQSICERVTSRLAHANAAVVLSSVKVLVKFLDFIDSKSEFVVATHRKLAPPLVTLLSAEPEIQYVALRNINLILQKKPDILRNDLRVFFVKYNDPIYVKLEKLDIMIRLTNTTNIGQVLSELKEYAAEADVDFVRKSVRAIGRCAIKIDKYAEKCVSTLLDLVKTKVNYVVQEAVIVIKDIFRKYPNKYEGIISALCENLDSLDEPEARASMVWIIGEYAERIENATQLLEDFLDTWQDESSHQVQLQLLTAIVKLFLKKPNEAQHLVTRVLQLASQESDNPDIRDRGYIYWRLLSADPQAARDAILAPKPLISEETDIIEPSLLDTLLSQIEGLNTGYRLPTSEPISTLTIEPDIPPSAQQSSTEFSSNLLDLDDDTFPTTVAPTSVDLLESELESVLGPPIHESDVHIDELFDFLSTSSSSNIKWFSGTDRIQGVEVWGNIKQSKVGSLVVDIELRNTTVDKTFSSLVLQINRQNWLGVSGSLTNIPDLKPSDTVHNLSIPLVNSTFNEPLVKQPLNELQIAFKCAPNTEEAVINYFKINVPVNFLFDPNWKMVENDFIGQWKALTSEHTFTLLLPTALSVREIVDKLNACNLHGVGSPVVVDGVQLIYQCGKYVFGQNLMQDTLILGEIRFSTDQNTKTVLKFLAG